MIADVASNASRVVGLWLLVAPLCVLVPISFFLVKQGTWSGKTANTCFGALAIILFALTFTAFPDWLAHRTIGAERLAALQAEMAAQPKP